MIQLRFVVQPGLEPRLAEPKSVVLPLHHWTIHFFEKCGCKITFFFSYKQIFLTDESQIKTNSMIFNYISNKIITFSLYRQYDKTPQINGAKAIFGPIDCIFSASDYFSINIMILDTLRSPLWSKRPLSVG